MRKSFEANVALMCGYIPEEVCVCCGANQDTVYLVQVQKDKKCILVCAECIWNWVQTAERCFTDDKADGTELMGLDDL